MARVCPDTFHSLYFKGTLCLLFVNDITKKYFIYKNWWSSNWECFAFSLRDQRGIDRQRDFQERDVWDTMLSTCPRERESLWYNPSLWSLLPYSKLLLMSRFLRSFLPMTRISVHHSSGDSVMEENTMEMPWYTKKNGRKKWEEKDPLLSIFWRCSVPLSAIVLVERQALSICPFSCHLYVRESAKATQNAGYFGWKNQKEGHVQEPESKFS